MFVKNRSLKFGFFSVLYLIIFISLAKPVFFNEEKHLNFPLKFGIGSQNQIK